MRSRAPGTWGLRPRAQAQLGTVLDALRAVGARGVVTEMPRWLVRREFIVLTVELHDAKAPAGRLPADLRLTTLTDADVPALTEVHSAMSEAEVRRRWAEGQECIVGWVGLVPAYYRWDCAGPAYLAYLRKTFSPPPLTILTLDVRTDPRFQGRRIGVFGADFANRRGLERGQLRRVGLIARWNRHVLRYNLALGASACGTVGYWHTGVRRLYFATGDARVEGGTISLDSRH